MKAHPRHGVLALALGLLALAAILGVARWNPSAPAHEPAGTSTAATEREVFVELPRASGAASFANGTSLPTKGSLRLPDADHSPGIELQPDQPRPGEPTYRMENLPKECGTYWVENADGGFSRLAVCHPENHPGGSH
jgi:hypothetical protein